jgi:hypothetical protein
MLYYWEHRFGTLTGMLRVYGESHDNISAAVFLYAETYLQCRLSNPRAFISLDRH